jgi:uncharacterized protein
MEEIKKIDLIKVENNQEAGRFETEVNGYLAVAEYQLSGDKILLTHTEVPRPIGGRGVANKLVKTALDFARDNHLQVVPLCSFVSAYIRRHPENKALLAAEPRF